MIYLFLLVLLVGMLVKAVDDIEDRKNKKKNPVRFIFAVLYGILLGYIIANASFAMLFLGAFFAQIWVGKVDRLSHQLAAAMVIFSLGHWGLPELDLSLFLFFFIFAYLDELILIKPLNVLSEYRMFLKLAALPFVFLGRWDYLAGILLFDGGYISAERIFKARP